MMIRFKKELVTIEELNNKISIIVPAYNVEKYISKCLDTLVNQTYKNIEIIVINDGSKDGTLSIIEEYAQKDKRIVVINQENQGLSESRNNAMDIATGNYIFFVDSDDWVDEDMCEVCLKKLLEENADLVLFSYNREFDNKTIQKSQFEENEISFDKEEIKYKLQRRIFGPYELYELAHPEKLDSLSTAWGKLYKHELIKKYRFKSFKEIGATCEDVFFNVEVLKDFKKALFIDKHLYHYRKTNVNALTKSAEKDLFDKWKKAYKCLSKIIEDNNYEESYKIALNNRFAINIIAIGQRIVNGADSFKTKYKMLKDILNDELYCKSISILDTKSMPIHWKVFFKFAKWRFTFGVYALFKVIKVLASKV